MLDDGISDLIARIYAGSHDRRVWTGVLDELLARTQSRFLLVSAVDLHNERYSAADFHGADDGRFVDAVADYHRDFYRSDPTLRFALENPRAGIVSLRAMIDRGKPDAASAEYARWVRSEMGAGDSCVRYTPPDDGLILGLSLHSRAGAEPMGRAQQRLFALLFGHVENAMRLVGRPLQLDDREALLLLGADGRVRQASAAAEALIRGGDGLRLAAGALRTARRDDQARLDAMIRGAHDGGIGGSVAITRPSGRRSLLLSAKPLPGGDSPLRAFGASAVVRIVDAETEAPHEADWAALFGFTAAERRLAHALLAEEQSLRRTAETLGVAYATARVQLASLFDKTGVRTQAQLMRLLTRLG